MSYCEVTRNLCAWTRYGVEHRVRKCSPRGEFKLAKIKCLPFSEEDSSRFEAGIEPTRKLEIEFESQTVIVPYTLGLGYIVWVIDNASRVVSLKELDGDGDGDEYLVASVEPDNYRDSEGMWRDSGKQRYSYNSVSQHETMSDSKAVTEARRLKSRLVNEEKKLYKSGEGANVISDQIKTINRYLTEVSRPGGLRAMPSKGISATKRARTAIQYSLSQLEKSHPAFFHHLKENLDLSNGCATYDGDVAWIIEYPDVDHKALISLIRSIQYGIDPELTPEQALLRDAAKFLRPRDDGYAVGGDDDDDGGYWESAFAGATPEDYMAQVNERLARARTKLAEELYLKQQFRTATAEVEQCQDVLSKLQKVFPAEFEKFMRNRWKTPQKSRITPKPVAWWEAGRAKGDGSGKLKGRGQWSRS